MDLFYVLWAPDLFMQRVQNSGERSLFFSNEAPGLADRLLGRSLRSFTRNMTVFMIFYINLVIQMFINLKACVMYGKTYTKCRKQQGQQQVCWIPYRGDSLLPGFQSGFRSDRESLFRVGFNQEFVYFREINPGSRPIVIKDIVSV